VSPLAFLSVILSSTYFDADDVRENQLDDSVVKSDIAGSAKGFGKHNDVFRTKNPERLLRSGFFARGGVDGINAFVLRTLLCPHKLFQ
jgi:hypothetical protein